MEAIDKACDYAEENGFGKTKVNFKIRDAVFGRQRYWGEPFPVYFEGDKPCLLPDDKLPLELPPVDKFLPTESGEPPLGRAENWHTEEGHPYEMTTMPGWAGSSWYFFRYMDPKNDGEFASKKALEYWQDVDLYVGGSEHATGHLLYSRFWTKFLYDRGFVPVKEYAKKLVNQGMIQGRSSIAYRINGTNTYVSKGLKKEHDTARIHVDVSMVENDVLDIERFKSWRPDLKDAEFILEDGKYHCGSEVEKMSKRLYNVVNPDDIVEQDYLNIGYALEHRFSENWQLRNQFRFTSSNFESDVFPFPLFLDESTGTLFRSFTFQETEVDTYSLYTNIQGTFNTGSVEHTLLVGIDLTRWIEEGLSGFAPVPTSLINIFDPDYPDSSSFPTKNSLPIFPGLSNPIETDQLGIYLQDQIDILDNLIIVGGLRYNTVNQEITDRFTNAVTEQYDDAFVPRIGVVYQPIEPISLYANYSRSFVPSLETDADENFLEPEEGEGFEAGIRGEIIENRLAATLAYFDITKQNVATPDPDPNNPFSSVATGEQQSRGVDFNLTGEILPGWNVVASYAYIDAEVTEDNDADLVGNRLFGAPEHSASLWTTYEIQSGDLQGLGFGFGFNLVGEQQGDLANSYQIDSYFLANAAIFYQQNNWQAQLNIDNIFDVDYVRASGFRGQINRGEPLTIRASVSYTF